LEAIMAFTEREALTGEWRKLAEGQLIFVGRGPTQRSATRSSATRSRNTSTA
jgi:hypothetical protein